MTQAPPAGAYYHQHHTHHHAWRHYQIFNDGLLRRSLSPSCSVAWTRSWADRPTSALSPASSPRRCRRTTVQYTFSNFTCLTRYFLFGNVDLSGLLTASHTSDNAALTVYAHLYHQVKWTCSTF